MVDMRDRLLKVIVSLADFILWAIGVPDDPPKPESKGTPEPLIYLRWDGHECTLAWVGCGRCKNYFRVDHGHCLIEQPACCPFCTAKFTGSKNITNEEQREITGSGDDEE